MEIEAILKHFLDGEGRLTAFPAKRKMKRYALYYLSTKLDKGVFYTEKQLNDLLKKWHTFGDPATLRRELYDNRFIDRRPDGMAYWLEEKPPQLEDLGL
nr:DUF2087 domain-containing protein [bacterium]